MKKKIPTFNTLLLDAVKARARTRGIPYTRFIRQLMEREVSDPAKPHR